MSKQIMEFKLENPKSFKEGKFPIFYGKCEESPNIENNLWFITLDRMFWEKILDSGWNMPFPFEHHTFLVEEKYATPFYMNQFGTDVMKWTEVAKKVFVGNWCERYEILWKDVPVYTCKHDSQIKYGYCRTQSSKPNRELWYVSFSYGSTFVVDKICTTNDFIKRMGKDMDKWTSICWCHLQHEVIWDELQTGTLDGGYVRSHKFSLDSPYIPASIEDIEARITKYEIDKMKR
jgi:hypothetical protein